MHNISHVAVPRRLSVPRSRRTLIIVGITLLAVLIVVRLVVAAARTAPSNASAEVGVPPQEIVVPPAPLTAHGVVQPISRSNVATVGGGTIVELLVSVGQSVDKGQALVRIAGATQSEL